MRPVNTSRMAPTVGDQPGLLPADATFGVDTGSAAGEAPSPRWQM